MNKQKIAVLLSSTLLTIGIAYAQSSDFNSSGVKLRGDGSVDDTQPTGSVVGTPVTPRVKLRGDGSVDDSPRVRSSASTDVRREDRRVDRREERGGRGDAALRVEVARTDRVARVERLERAEKPEKVEKVEKPEKVERHGGRG